ncbi:glycosyltransferase [Geodermatophilus sp. SYSU D00696]
MSPDTSVIVRSRNKAKTIEATFQALRAQSRPVEIVVVDSGSTDGTVEIAKKWADVLIEIAPESFSYGRALNVGADAASGAIHFALSAHCRPTTNTWVEDSLSFYQDERVVGTCEAFRTPAGEPIQGVYLPPLDEARSQPAWGFSNHASSWRADTWRTFRFREDLPACEDKEWSWRVLAAGHHIAFSPQLFVPSGHRRSQGLVLLRRRVTREALAMVSLGVARPPTLSEAVAAWWGSFSAGSDRSVWIRRLSPYRFAELAGAWAGARQASLLGDGSPTGGEGSQGDPSTGSTDVPPYLPWTQAPRR